MKAGGSRPREEAQSMANAPPTLFPVFFNLADRRVAVVGGGAVAERKVSLLLGTGAAIVVVAPALTPWLRDAADAGSLEHVPAPFTPASLDGAWLVVAATDQGGVNQAVAAAARERRIPCNVVDDLFPWAASGRAIANGRDEGFTKLLFDDSPEAHGHGRILGGGIVGTHAGDMIGEIALAIEMGADAVDIGKTIHPHPTLGESIGMAAEIAHGSCTDVPPQRR